MNANSTEQLFVKGYLDFPVADLETLRLAFQKHAVLSRQEEGCLSFEFHDDTEIEGRIHLAETYVNAAAFEAHKARAAGSAWAEAGKNVVRSLQVTTGSPD